MAVVDISDLGVTSDAGALYQALPNQNTESGDICHFPFHGICLWLTSSDPSLPLIP